MHLYMYIHMCMYYIIHSYYIFVCMYIYAYLYPGPWSPVAHIVLVVFFGYILLSYQDAVASYNQLYDIQRYVFICLDMYVCKILNTYT
jgi:hypothetical protein